MRNAKSRFALDDDGSLYCYKLARHYAPVGELDEGHGVWDLEKVKELILEGKSIESAYTKTPVVVGDKVQAAKTSFMASPELTTPGAKLQAAIDTLKQHVHE